MIQMRKNVLQIKMMKIGISQMKKSTSFFSKKGQFFIVSSFVFELYVNIRNATQMAILKIGPPTQKINYRTQV